MKHCPLRIGLPASWKVVVAMVLTLPKPPLTQAGLSIQFCTVFIAAWTAGDPGFGAYIDNLHVHPERRSAGLGRRLLGAAMRRVADRGEARAYLWVFDGNTRAIDFYRRLGGEIVERGFDEIDGLKVAQSRIAWGDTSRLAEACA